MDMRTVLEKISALSSPALTMAGGSHAPVAENMGRCAACGQKTHLDASTEFCIDCLDQIAKDQGKEGYRDVTDAADTVDESVMCETCSKSMESCECEELEEAKCPDCGSDPCDCKSSIEEEQLGEVTPPGFKKEHPGLMGKLKGEYPGEPSKAYATAWKISKGDEEMEESADDKEFHTTPECVSDCYDNERHSLFCPHYNGPDSHNDVYGGDDEQTELAKIKKLAECGDMWAAPQPASGMNVTTNVDSKTGNKTVTVTADGAGAEELMQILTMAGIAVAPTAAPPVAMAEELANEPNPDTLDAETQLVGMSGGPNAPHGQYNQDRGRDNSMSMVDEAVDQLAEKLRSRFINESVGNKTFKVMVKYDDPSGKGIASKTFNIKSVRDAKHAKDVVELKHMKNLKNPKIMRATEVEDL